MGKYNTKDNGRKISLMDGDYTIAIKASLSRTSGKNMKDRWEKEKWMEEVSLSSRTGSYTKESSSWERFLAEEGRSASRELLLNATGNYKPHKNS